MLRTAREDLDRIDWSPIIPARILIIVADYNTAISDMLLTGAARRLEWRIAPRITTAQVSGVLEIPPLIHQSHTMRPHDGYLALGCVLRGATAHFDIVARESARGLTLLGLDGVLIANGILTADTSNHALERADPDQADRGGEAADALLRLMLATRSLSRSDD